MNVELIFHRLFVPIASVKARSVFCNNFEKNFSFFRRDKFLQINFVMRYYFIYTSRRDFALPPPPPPTTYNLVSRKKYPRSVQNREFNFNSSVFFITLHRITLKYRLNKKEKLSFNSYKCGNTD